MDTYLPTFTFCTESNSCESRISQMSVYILYGAEYADSDLHIHLHFVCVYACPSVCTIAITQRAPGELACDRLAARPPHPVDDSFSNGIRTGPESCVQTYGAQNTFSKSHLFGVK
jgi:hypothetical protein